MEILSVFCLLIAVLLVVMVIGHGLWLLCAAVFRAMSSPVPQWQEPDRPARKKPRRQLECARCGYKLPEGISDCPRCGLDCEGLVAEELKDLEAMARQLERFRRNNDLPEEVLAQVWSMLQGRHERLVGSPQFDVPTTPLSPLPASQARPKTTGAEEKPVSTPAEKEKSTKWIPTTPLKPVALSEAEEDIPSVIPVEQVEQQEKREAAPVWRRLQQILANGHEDELTASDRVKVVMWFRQTPQRHLQELPPAIQRKLARVLKSAGLVQDALTTYGRCLALSFPHREFVDVGLEAARLALQHDPDKARAFLLQIGVRPQTPNQKHEIEQLWDQLRKKKVAPEPKAKPKTAELIPSYYTETEEEAPPVSAPSAAPPATPAHAETLSYREPSPSPATASAAPERRSRWLDILESFMEERNILWGELVGGLLIVGGSIALVISLWNQLQQNPYFPFGIFAVITAALFGAGLYTWSHWKLQATSRGLLVIASLLVPLTFLVLPSTLGMQVGSVVEMPIAVAGLALFAWCLHRAARVLTLEGKWLLPPAVLLCAVGQLATAALINNNVKASFWLVPLGFLPVLCQTISTLGVREQLRRRTDFAIHESGSLFATAGISTFAAGVALGFLIVHCPDPLTVVQHLAPLLTLLALPVLLTGLLIHDRLAPSEKLAALRTTGTGIALAAVAVMFFALAVAWPQPRSVVLVGLLNFAILTWTAFRHRLPLVQAPALLCLALAWLMAFHWQNNFSAALAPGLDAVFLSMQAAMRLVLFGVALAVAAELLARLRQNEHARYYAAAAAIAAAYSVILATRSGHREPLSAALIYIIAGMGCLCCNLRWSRVWLSYAGLVLVIAASLWSMQGWFHDRFLLWPIFLAAEALLLSLLGVVLTLPTLGKRSSQGHTWFPSSSLGTRCDQVFGWPLLHCAKGVALLAIIAILTSRVLGEMASLDQLRSVLDTLRSKGNPLDTIANYLWQLEHVVAGFIVVFVYLVLTIKERRPLSGAMMAIVVLGTVTAATDCWVRKFMQIPLPQAAVALAIAITSCVLGAISLAIHLRQHAQVGQETKARWYDILPLAWREVLVISGVLALWISMQSERFLSESTHPFTFGLVAALAWMMAGQYRNRLLSWIGSTLLLVGIGLFVNSFLTPDHVPYLLLSALLVHAAVLVIVGLALRRLARKQNPQVTAIRVFAFPFLQAALVSTFLTLPFLLLKRGDALPLGGFAAWLALLWLVVSWSDKHRLLFAGCQLAAAMAVVYAVTYWLTAQSWIEATSLLGWCDPRSLQAYDFGLALLCLVFVGARIALQRNSTAQVLLLPNWPGVDRWLLGGLLVSQLGLVDWAILYDVLREIVPTQLGWNPNWWPAVYVHAYGPGAWLLFSAILAVLVTSLWQPAPRQRQTGAIIGLASLAITFPALVAGAFAQERAVASALRWFMAIVFLIASAPLWARNIVAAMSHALAIPTNDDPNLSRKVRIVLIDGLVLPVLALTITLAVLLIAFQTIPGPMRASFFRQVGPFLSLFVPLGLIALTLVGHAVRERSPGYAYSAGLVTTCAAAGGYALNVVLAGTPFGHAQWVLMLQIAAIVSAIWGTAWLLSRKFVFGLSEEGHSPLVKPLLALQVVIPITLNVILPLPAILYLTPLVPWEQLADSEIWYSAAPAWTVAVGTLPSWIALALTVLVVYVHQRGTISNILVGCTGLAVIALVACTITRVLPTEGMRAFMVGLGVFALAWALVPWFLSRVLFSTDSSRADEYFNTAVGWCYVACIALVPLSLQAIFVHNDHLWGASMIVMGGVAICMIGLQRGEEISLLAGSTALSFAVSVFLWHFLVDVAFTQWWVHLLQAIGITTLAVAAGWLKVLRGTYRHQGSYRRTTLLPLQLAIGILCILVPVVVSLYLLAADPRFPPFTIFDQMNSSSGWLGVLLAFVMAAWFMGLVRPRHQVHVFGIGGIVLANQLAVAVSTLDTGNWLTYHMLTTALGIVGLVLCLGGWAAGSGRLLGPRYLSQDMRQLWTDHVHVVFPLAPTRLWVESLGIVLVGLAFRAGLQDPTRPYFSVFLVLLAGGLAAGLLTWTRKSSYLHILGNLVGIAAFLCWLAWGQGSVENFLYALVLFLGSASLATAPLESWLQRHPPQDSQKLRPHATDIFAFGSLYVFTGLWLLFLLVLSDARSLAVTFAPVEEICRFLTEAALPLALLFIAGLLIVSTLSKAIISQLEWNERQQLSFSLPACFIGLNVLGVLVLLGIAADLVEQPTYLAGRVAWISWLGVGVAAMAQIVVKRSPKSAAQGLPLYMAGLLGIGLGLHQAQLEAQWLAMQADIWLAAFVLLAGVAVWSVLRFGAVRKAAQRIGISLPAQTWFTPAQICFGLLVVGLSFWSCTSLEHVAGRLVGPLALLLLLVAAVLLVFTADKLREQPQPILRSTELRYGTLVLGSLLLLTFAWSWLNQTEDYPGLLRHILILGVLSAMTLVYGLGLRQLLPLRSPWSRCSQNLARIYWLAGMIVVFTLLTHELTIFHPALKPTLSLAPWAIALVAAVLVAFVVSSVWFAVLPKYDPFALSENWRRKYIYAGEVLVVLLLLHIKLTAPELFTERLKQYWPFLVMVLAFAGVGLSELFNRLKLPVLAVPMQRTGVFLPLVPLLAFWLQSSDDFWALVLGMKTTIQFDPEKMNFSVYASYWFLAAGVYVLMSFVRRSSWFALVAALAVNFGFWSLLFQHREIGLGFLSHPQLWLIPLALIFLGAEYINRDRLDSATAASLRYLGLLTLYLSSAADLFINGIDDIGMSLVLAVLAVLGILAGILLRVRAFLYVGFVSLLLVIGTQIVNAAVYKGQTWVWWVAVICLGITILTLFALFEKRRMDMLKMLEELKRWK